MSKTKQTISIVDDASSISSDDSDAVDMLNNPTFRAMGYYLESNDKSITEHVEGMREDITKLTEAINKLVAALSISKK